MLHLEEVNEEIAELEGQKNHSVNDLHALSSLYTIRDHAFGREDIGRQEYSQAAGPAPASEPLGLYGDSDFLRAVDGKDPAEAWAVMDKLMDTLRLSFPRAYNRVMREIREL